MKTEMKFMTSLRDPEDFTLVLLPTMIFDRERYGINLGIFFLCWAVVLKIKFDR